MCSKRKRSKPILPVLNMLSKIITPSEHPRNNYQILLHDKQDSNCSTVPRKYPSFFYLVTYRMSIVQGSIR